VLTDRGRWILAFGGAVYLAAWAFGTTALYPIGLGLVLAVAAAALWVRLLNRPMRVNRTLGKGEHLAGDDIPVRLEIDVGGRMPSGALTVVERIAKFGEVETVILSRHGRLRGGYILDGVPRGQAVVDVLAVPQAAQGSPPFAFGAPIDSITVSAGKGGHESKAKLTYEFLAVPMAPAGS